MSYLEYNTTGGNGLRCDGSGTSSPLFSLPYSAYDGTYIGPSSMQSLNVSYDYFYDSTTFEVTYYNRSSQEVKKPVVTVSSLYDFVDSSDDTLSCILVSNMTYNSYYLIEVDTQTNSMTSHFVDNMSLAGATVSNNC